MEAALASERLHFHAAVIARWMALMLSVIALSTGEGCVQRAHQARRICAVGDFPRFLPRLSQQAPLLKQADPNQVLGNRIPILRGLFSKSQTFFALLLL